MLHKVPYAIECVIIPTIYGLIVLFTANRVELVIAKLWSRRKQKRRPTK